jgi:hypothetical protein
VLNHSPGSVQARWETLSVKQGSYLWGLVRAKLTAPNAPNWSRTPNAPDACRLLRHLSYARTTRDFEARGLDGARRDLDEYRRASAKTFRHILMNCSLLLSPVVIVEGSACLSRFLCPLLCSLLLSPVVIVEGSACLSRFLCPLLCSLLLVRGAPRHVVSASLAVVRHVGERLRPQQHLHHQACCVSDTREYI